MRPTHITPSHAGIPATEGYSRDPEGTREWLEDVLQHADTSYYPDTEPLTGLQKLVIRLFGLRRFIRRRELQEFARGRRYVARTALSHLLLPAPKGWGSTD